MLFRSPEHSTLHQSPPPGANSVPVEVNEVAFEGNFVNIHVYDAQGGAHIVQVQNDPSQPPPAPGAKLSMAFTAEHAVVLADTVVRHG